MISRREIDKAGAALTKAGKTQMEIYQGLLALGARQCVARDWANECIRREKLFARAKERAAQRHRISRRGTKYRRVIASHTGGGRIIMQHATKGIRNMRA